MANIKSAKKRILVNQAKALQNQMVKSQLKTVIKKFNAAVEAGDKTAASEAYKLAVKKVDQATAHGILHKNNAAHRSPSSPRSSTLWRKTNLKVCLTRAGFYFFIYIIDYIKYIC